ncbi:GNAT family N-acetyltransferase [Clostridium sp.]|uniref:GNAT family N-acetyltransferase n=1 Tax=Clostridium sp. TaxID=1506 RepID=UPI003217D97C
MGNIATERLTLRKIKQSDYEEMKIILQDEKLMLVGWGKTYSDEEVQVWIDKITEQYEDFGYSYYLAVEKSTNVVIGIMGILPVNIKETDYIEIAYILKQKFSGKGYAIEGIKGCVDYIFNVLNADKYIAQVIPENTSSSKIAERLGMKVIDDYMRDHNGKDIFHLIYALTKEEYIQQVNK